MNTKESVRNFVISGLNYTGDPAELTDDYPLLEKGVLDSIGIFHLVTFLENEFGVEIADEELLPDHFHSISAIGKLIEDKRR